MDKKHGSMASLFALVLVGFFLPFYEVSCNGQPVASATGYELSVSDAPPARADRRILPIATEQEVPGTRTTWLLAVPALALVGAALSVLAARRPEERRRVRRLVLGAIGAAVAIAALLTVNFLVIRSRVKGDLPPPRPELRDAEPFLRGLAESILVRLQLGWYLAFLGSLAAGLVGALFTTWGAGAAAKRPAPPSAPDSAADAGSTTPGA